jgi:signal transduction histidine kinase
MMTQSVPEASSTAATDTWRSAGQRLTAMSNQRHDDRHHVQLLRRWRWLVLAIAIPISLVIEILEGNSHDLHFLDEVIIDGLVLPVSTWIILTFAARKILAQFEHQATLEQRQRFMQQLAEHRDYDDLAKFLVRYPSTLLPVERATLSVSDRQPGRPDRVTRWSASPGEIHEHAAPESGQRRADSSPHEVRLVLLHEQEQIGFLWLRLRAGRRGVTDQIGYLSTLAPEMAQALVLAIEDSRQAEQAYQEARFHERRRIAHELHDSLAQQVFYLHLNLDQLAEDETQITNAAARRKIESMRAVAADVYERVRHNLSILRTWEQVDLTEAVSELARVTAHNAEIAIDITVQGEPKWLSPHTCEHLYGVVREALNNVVKHARAQRVQLELHWSATHLSMHLVDDGIGFEPAQPAPEGHYGLALMREAVEALQGDMLLESAYGGGTTLRVTVPLRLPDPYLRQRDAWLQKLHTTLDTAF